MTKLEDLARDEIIYLPVAAIDPDPDQPRLDVDDELAESIRQHGVLQAIQVRPHPSGADDRWMIVDGERRYRGAAKAKADTIPATITLEVEAVADRIIRQIVRNEGKPLTPSEEAIAFKRAILDRRGAGDSRYGVVQLAKELGYAKSTVADRLAMTEIPAFWLPLIADGPLQASHVPLLHRWRKVPEKYQQKALEQMKADYRWAGGDSYSKAKKGERIYVSVFETLLDTFMYKFIKPVGDCPGYDGPTDTFETRTGWPRRRLVHAMDPSKWQTLYRRGLAAKKKRTASRARAQDDSPAPAREDKWAKQRAGDERARERFAVAAPAILAASATAVETAPIDMLANLLGHDGFFDHRATDERFPVPESGLTADLLVCRLAFSAVARIVANQWGAPQHVPKLAKLLGLNLKALLAGSGSASPHSSARRSSTPNTVDDDAIIRAPDAPYPVPSVECKYCLCTEENACQLEGGEPCGWYDRSVPVCSNPECISNYQEDVQASTEDSEGADALETVES